MDQRRVNLLSNKERMKNDLEVKLLLKNAKININIINNRNRTRQNLHNKYLLREQRLEKAKINSDLKISRKINNIRNRHMSRDIKDIQNKYKSINPYLSNDLIKTNINNNKDYYYYYSNNRKKYINELKKKFYEKNYSLLGINNVINEVKKLYNDYIVNEDMIKENNDYYGNNNYSDNNNNENYLKMKEGKNTVLPIIQNRYHINEIINKDYDNNNNNNNNYNYIEEEERKNKLQKILDSYKDN